MVEKKDGRREAFDRSKVMNGLLRACEKRPISAAQLEAILLASAIPIEEIVGSGGGETKGTQRLRRALHEHGWRKHKFEITRSIDGVARVDLARGRPYQEL